MSRRWPVDVALAAYPPWWRDRYGEEAGALCDDLLAEGAAAYRLAPGLLAGAVGARVRGTGIPPLSSAHRRRAQASLAVTAAAMLSVVPLAVWAFGTTRFRSAEVGAPRVVPGPGGAGDAVMWSKFALLLLAAALVVELVGAWGVASPAGRRCPLRWAPAGWVAVAAAAAVGRGRVLPVGIAVHGSPGGVATVTDAPGGHPALAWALGVVAWVAVWLVVASAAALVVVAGRAGAEMAGLAAARGYGRRLAVTGTLAALSAAAWAAALAVEGPAPAHGSYAVVTSSLRGWAGPLATVVLVLAVLAWAGLVQAGRSLRSLDEMAARATT